MIGAFWESKSDVGAEFEDCTLKCLRLIRQRTIWSQLTKIAFEKMELRRFRKHYLEEMKLLSINMSRARKNYQLHV